MLPHPTLSCNKFPRVVRCFITCRFFFGKNASFSSTRKHADEDEDGFMGSTGNKSRNTKRGRGRAEELDTVEEDENL